MERRKVDVAIIGAGTAGLGAFHEARKFTDNVAIIEGGAYGTTCARVGCMPSKLLIAAAEAAHGAEGAKLFGIHAEGLSINGREVMARVQRERDRFVGFVVDAIGRIPAELRIRGEARFIDPHRLGVDDGLEIEADRIVIATGSRPHVPQFLQEAGDRLLTSDSLFELEELPASVAVFGPGVIGLELGQALSRLGVDVRMFGVSGTIGPIQDEGIRQEAYRYFNEEFYLDPEAKVSRVAHTGEGVAVTYRHRDRGELTETFDYLLAATGRRPNIDRIGMEHSGLELDERGMPDHDHRTMRCSSGHIFLAGDASNEIPLLHEASDEGHIAGTNAGRYPDVRPGQRRAPLAVVFTDPQIATVGLTGGELQEHRYSYGVGEVSFENQGRSRVLGRNRGKLRVYGEQGSGLFLGAEMFGPAAEHIAHLLAWSVQAGLTVPQMLEMPFYHPVIEEGVRTALRDLNHDLHLGPEIVESCMECGPGS
jgi:dihydrolipoamide dehydrogenase